MQLKYPCFISYCHGQFDLMKGFICQLTENLNSCIEPYFDEHVYYDKERLKPGYIYNAELAKAICQSVCMIVVYVPKYERHPYCLKEYKAMEIIEEKRLELIECTDPTRGMIIPIILRGNVPSKIKNYRYYCDFTQFTTASAPKHKL